VTGHYARIIDGPDGRELHRAVDPLKDQSSVLSVLDSKQLAGAMFPLGESTKDEVRAEAATRGLRVADKPDSHDICFIPDGDTAGFLRDRLGERPGDLVDALTGEVVGQHDGTYAFTIGQRRGLALTTPTSAGDRRYVVDIDADSRNIEELTVEAHPEMYSPRKTPEELSALKTAGFTFEDYEGMMAQMEEDTLVIDDISEHETEMLIAKYKPDIICAGIKEKYSIQKSGTPSLQLHSYDYGGPFAGFAGAINFYKTIDKMLAAEFWKYIKAPWEKVGEPKIEATLGV